jgi:hypothetical protein
MAPRRGRKKVLVIVYFDYFGKPEDFEKLKKVRKEVCAGIEGVKHLGTYASHQARYHYAFIEEWDSYDRMSDIGPKVREKVGPRDRNVMTHAIIEVFSEV